MLINNKLILGTVQFGLNYGINNVAGKPNKDTVFQILQYTFENKIIELDSASAYGESEQLIGEFISDKKFPFLINTKFNLESDINVQISKSLSLLKIEKLNTYFYHDIMDLKNNPDSIETVKSLKSNSIINKIGVSVYTNEEFEFAIAQPAIDTIQIPFNLLDNYNKRGKLIQKAKQKNKEIQIRSVYLQGLFMKPLESFSDKLKPLAPYINQLRKLSKDFGIALQDVALCYSIQQSEIDKVLIGVDNLEQLKNNVAASQSKIPLELINAINEIVVKEEALLYPYNWS